MNIELAKHLKVAEVAELLSMKENTLRKWILLRKLPYIKVNGAVRIPATALARLLEAGRIPAREEG
jgi:excisionase family DNA binding protein